MKSSRIHVIAAARILLWAIGATVLMSGPVPAAPTVDLAKKVATAIEAAEKLRAAQKPDEALEALRVVAREVKQVRGPGVAELLPIYDVAAEILIDQENVETAEKLLTKTAGIRERLLDDGDASQAEPLGTTLLLLSGMQVEMGRLQPALDSAKQAVIVLDTSLGPDHEATRRARDALTKTLGAFDEMFGVDHESTLAAGMGLISLQESLGQYAEAITARKRRITALRKRHGPDHPEVLAEIDRLSRLLLVAGRPEEAIADQKQAVAAWTAIATSDAAVGDYSVEHARADPRVIGAIRLLGELHLAAEQFTLAERAFSRARDANVAYLRETHPEAILDRLHLLDVSLRRAPAQEAATKVAELATRLMDVEDNDRAMPVAARGLLLAGRILARMGDPARARDCAKRVLGAQEFAPKVRPEDVVAPRALLGEALLALDGHADAVPVLEEAVWDAERSLGSGDPRTLAVVVLLSKAFAQDGDVPTAAYLLERVIDRRVPRFDPLFEEELVAAIDELADAPPSADAEAPAPESPDGATRASLRERFLALRREQFGDDHRYVGIALSLFGRGRGRAGDWKRAATFHEQAIAVATKSLGADHPEVAGMRVALADALWRAGSLPPAEAAAATAVTSWEKAAGPAHRGTLAAVRTLAGVKLEEAQPKAAIPLLERLRGALEKQAPAEARTRALARTLVRLADAYARTDDKTRGLATAKAAAALDCWKPGSSAAPADVEAASVALATLSTVFTRLGAEEAATDSLQRARGLATALESPRATLARIQKIVTDGPLPADVPL
jgi:tetratricopeptide (TPR) repeat protein